MLMEPLDRFDKFTDRARKVLTLAQEEATRFNHNYIGTEHLLLGLVREEEGIAARVLDSLGVNLERVRTQTIQVLSQSSGEHGRTVQSLSQSSGTTTWTMSPADAPGSEAPARRVRWEYCLVQVAHPDPGESGVVRRVQGGGDEGRLGRDTVPIHQALQALGAEGWELVAVDTGPRESGSSGAAYILKRPL
jgi:hypothetical protein